MPLRKPTAETKTQKSHKKNIAIFKTITPILKENKIEYKCKFYYKFDQIENKKMLAVRIETITLFNNFSYEIVTEAQKVKNSIEIGIVGLKAKINSIPAIAPAYSDIHFDDLIGDYEFSVIKNDGCINSVKINFNNIDNKIKILSSFVPEKKNNRLFCEFYSLKSKY